MRRVLVVLALFASILVGVAAPAAEAQGEFVDNPGDQRSRVGDVINLPINYSGNLNVVGLPGGLSFDGSAITGSPIGTGGWPIELRLSNGNGQQVEVAYFRWVVTNGAPPGVVAEHPAVDPNNVSQRPMEGHDGVVWNYRHQDTTASLDITVWDMQQLGDWMYVGGEFEQVQEQAANGGDGPRHNQAHLARFSIQTGEWDPTFRPQLDGNVHALEVSPRGLLLVGGEFTNIDGIPGTQGLAAFNPNTSQVDTSFEAWVERPWYPQGRAIIREMEVVGDFLYIGGNFSHVNGPNGQRFRVNKLARVGANYGTIDASWAPVVSGGSVWGIGVDQDRGRVYINGRFTSVNGRTIDAETATVTTETGESVVGLADHATNNSFRTEQYDIEYAGGAIWQAGSQHVLQLLDADTHQLTEWTIAGNRCKAQYCWSGAGVGGDYQFVEKIGDFVYAGCHCNDRYDRDGNPSIYNTVTGQMSTHTVSMAFNLDGSLVTDVRFDIGGHIDGGWSVASDDRGCVWLGGDIIDGGFYEPGGRVFARGFARFCDAEVYVPGGLSVVADAPGGVVIEWNPTPNGGGYLVYRDGSYLGYTTDTSFQDDSAIGGVTYTYQVRSENVFGEQSDLSPGLEVVVGEPDTEPPTTPSRLSVVNSDDSSVEFSWNPSTDNTGIASYLVFRDGAFIGSTAADQTSYYDSGLQRFDTHEYTVRAVDLVGLRSERSAPLTITIGGADTEPPTVPQNLTIDDADNSSVLFSWDASSDNAGVFNYLVYRDGAYIGWTAAATTAFTDTGLTPFTTYSYTVRAVDTAENRSELSVPLEVTIGGEDNEAPTAPTNLTVVNGDASSVEFSWDPSSDNAGVTSYLVYRDGSYVGWTPAGTTSFTDTGLTPFLTYNYTVRAVDAVGNRSERSLPLEVTVGGADVEPPTVPANLTEVAVGDTSVEFSWDPSTDNAGVFNYLVYRDGGYIGWTPAGTTSFTDTGLTPLTAYSYTVRAVDVNQNRSERSLPLDVSPGGADVEPPSVPQRLTVVTQDDSSVEFSWQASNDNAGLFNYLVYRDGAYIGWTPAGVTSFTDTGLTPFRSYSYQVRAVDINGNRSDRSAALDVAIGGVDDQLPSVPVNLVATSVTDSTVDFVWDPSIDNAGVSSYLIYRDGAYIGWTPAGTTSFSDSGLISGTTYAYTVRSTDINGLRSDQSLPLDVTTN